MAETGVDMFRHKSKRVDEFLDEPWDVVVTVCGHAHETCPLFPGDAKIVHMGFDDPPALAREETTEEGAWLTTAGCATRFGHSLNPCQSR